MYVESGSYNWQIRYNLRMLTTIYFQPKFCKTKYQQQQQNKNKINIQPGPDHEYSY